MLTGEKHREQEGTTVQVTSRRKTMSSKHHDRVDINPFLYTQRKGIGTTKKKKGKDECDNALVILCRYGTVKREKEKGENERNSVLAILRSHGTVNREKKKEENEHNSVPAMLCNSDSCLSDYSLRLRAALFRGRCY